MIKIKSEIGSVAVSIVSVILALIVVVGLAFAGYEFHWWMAKNNNNHISQIYRSGYENQSTLRIKIYNDMDVIAQLRSEQRQSTTPSDFDGQITLNVRTTCHEIDQLTGTISFDISSFKTQECY